MLQRVSNGTGSPTDTISFNGYTDVTINGSQTSTTKYYIAGGQTIAMGKDGVFSYLLPDTLGSVSLTLYADGSTKSVQVYAPYGLTRYSDGTTPTVYGFTGQRADAQTGLMYYRARYYDPVSGRFISADDKENNAAGDDPYAYVGDNPETMTDPTGNAMVDQEGDTAWPTSDGGSAYTSASTGKTTVIYYNPDAYCNSYACYDSNGNVSFYKNNGGGSSSGSSSASTEKKSVPTSHNVLKAGPSPSQQKQMQKDKVNALNNQSFWEKVGSDVLAATPLILNIISGAKTTTTRLENAVSLGILLTTNLLPDLSSKFGGTALLMVAIKDGESTRWCPSYIGSTTSWPGLGRKT